MMSSTLEQMKSRRSIRRYKSDPIPQALMDQILEAGLYAANGMGQQNTIMIQVSDPVLRDEISRRNREIGGWSEDFDPFYGAPEMIIVLARKDWRNRIYDGSLVMGNLMLAAHELGLGSCWIHRAREEFESPWGQELLRSLGITEEYEGIGHCALGYVDGPLPEAAPRKPGRVYKIKRNP